MDYHKLANEMFEFCCSGVKQNIDRSVGKIMQGEAFALNFLYEHNSIAYPRELSSAMNVSTARIARLLNKLEDDGKITRSPDENDSRQIIVTITELGTKTVIKQRENSISFLAAILEKLGEEDAKEYVRINKKLAEIAKSKGNEIGI